MVWFISFVISWILFFVLVKKNQPKTVYIVGLVSIFFQLLIDLNANYIGLYKLHEAGIDFYGTSLFFTLGPVFTMAVLFVQYIPRAKWLQLLHVIVFVTLFMIFEIAVESMGALEYIHWNHLASLFVDITVFMALSWVGVTFIYKGHEENMKHKEI